MTNVKKGAFSRVTHCARILPMPTISLRHGGQIEIGPDWTRVTLPSGAVVEGRPQGTVEQGITAWHLGYGGDTEAMVRSHDPLHALLADMLIVPLGSYSLRCAAGEPCPKDRAALEEAAVMALQRYACALGLDAIGIADRNGYAVS